MKTMRKKQAAATYANACKAYLKAQTVRCKAAGDDKTYKQALAVESKAYEQMIAAEKRYARFL